MHVLRLPPEIPGFGDYVFPTYSMCLLFVLTPSAPPPLAQTGGAHIASPNSDSIFGYGFSMMDVHKPTPIVSVASLLGTYHEAPQHHSTEVPSLVGTSYRPSQDWEVPERQLLCP